MADQRLQESGREIDRPWPKPLYEHGGGRELSTKQWDHYKEPVVHVVPVDVEVVPRADAEALARAVSASLTHGEDSPLVAALTVYLAKHPWSDL